MQSRNLKPVFIINEFIKLTYHAWISLLSSDLSSVETVELLWPFSLSLFGIDFVDFFSGVRSSWVLLNKVVGCWYMGLGGNRTPSESMIRFFYCLLQKGKTLTRKSPFWICRKLHVNSWQLHRQKRGKSYPLTNKALGGVIRRVIMIRVSRFQHSISFQLDKFFSY